MWRPSSNERHRHRSNTGVAPRTLLFHGVSELSASGSGQSSLKYLPAGKRSINQRPHTEFNSPEAARDPSSSSLALARSPSLLYAPEACYAGTQVPLSFVQHDAHRRRKGRVSNAARIIGQSPVLGYAARCSRAGKAAVRLAWVP